MREDLLKQVLFEGLPPESLSQLSSLCRVASFAQGATLFEEGDEPRGVFILLSGRAKVSFASRAGNACALHGVEPGQALGISSVIANLPYLVGAKTVAPSQVAFVPREAFLQFLRTHPRASLWLAQQLSHELHRAWPPSTLAGAGSERQREVCALVATLGRRARAEKQ